MRIIRPSKDHNKLYYYCRLATALEYVLPEMRLLLSPIMKTNDPRENKTPLFTYNSNQGSRPIGMFELNEKCNLVLKEDCKVTCFSKDYKNYQGCHLSKMWAQYGDNHKGVCFEIDKEKFLNENSSIILDGLFKDICYTDYDYLRRSTQLNINLTKYEKEGTLNYLKQEFRNKNLDQLYFTKNDEWESESEVRLLVFSESKENEYCSIRNSLVSIHLGVDFHESYLGAIKEFVKDVYIYKMKFLHEGLVCTYTR